MTNTQTPFEVHHMEYQHMLRLSDKVAVVTGGNSGIGYAAAAALVAAEANVVIDAAVHSLGVRASGIVGDVADLSTHDQVCKLVQDRCGGLDVYVANAGVNVIQPSAAVTIEDYDAQFGINARGLFFGVQKIMPLLRDGASIILTSSIASSKVLEGHAVYAGTKAAIEAFARNWAMELKDRRIRVNVVSPGAVDTPILGKLGILDDARPDFEAHMADAIPLGRMGRAEELGRAILFLASQEASFITGTNLSVDGGMSLT